MNGPSQSEQATLENKLLSNDKIKLFEEKKVFPRSSDGCFVVIPFGKVFGSLKLVT